MILLTHQLRDGVALELPLVVAKCLRRKSREIAAVTNHHVLMDLTGQRLSHSQKLLTEM
jgi:hypothetical protein